MYDFFNFRKMITPVLIKILFVIEILVCLIVGWGFIKSMNNGALGILIIVLGIILARISCESLIVIFSIHSNLEELNNKTLSIHKDIEDITVHESIVKTKNPLLKD